jgi:hypothetical protein
MAGQVISDSRRIDHDAALQQGRENVSAQGRFGTAVSTTELCRDLFREKSAARLEFRKHSTHGFLFRCEIGRKIGFDLGWYGFQLIYGYL